MRKDSYVNVSFVGDQKMRKLNEDYRNKDYTTDVLSFLIEETMEDGTDYLGDIVVNIDQAKRQAEKFGNTFEEEIAELVAHGMLHLQGVHH
ncbi:rRNA maturation RNase YbeY [candidate division WWE3 bacterium]|nr:rRNA maturation RNase YbeY [candidate division WWE3 bacterium]